MNPEELMKLLGVKPEELKTVEEKKAPPAPTKGVGGFISDAALVLDKWDRDKGLELQRHPDTPKEATSKELADFHGVAFKTEPTLEETCADPLRLEFLRTLLESPDTHSLRISTVLRQLPSREAAFAFARQFQKLKDEIEKRKEEGKKADPKKDGRKVIAAVDDALKEAGEKVEELSETFRAVGCGPGEPGNDKLSVDRLASLFHKIKNKEAVRRIMNKAGKFRRFAQSRQRMKIAHGHDDVVGVTVGGDIGKLIPSELAMLATPETELDAYRRLLENQALVKEYRGSEKVGKGPIVVCVDESGSMDGDPVENAKAFSLAMAWIARHQKRWISLIGYSGGTEGNLLTMPPNKWDQDKLVEWLAHFYSGGTTMDVPLVELPTRYWKEMAAPKGRTDVILITDALCKVPQHIADPFNTWKKAEQVRCFTFVLGGASPGDLVKITDELFVLRDISTGEEGVAKALSI